MKVSQRTDLTLAASRAAKALVIALSCLACFPVAARAAMRALVVGVDDYAHVQKLRGAVADARDVENALRKVGVTDMTALIDQAATRRAVLDALDDLVARTRPDDTIFITLAGNGGGQPEPDKNSPKDGKGAVFLLRNFAPQEGTGAAEKILAGEFNRYIARLEAQGGRVIFIADSGPGGGWARSVDPRGQALLDRSVADGRAAASAAPLELRHSLVLAATDGKTPVPELNVAGLGPRGALSFAFARALEGSANSDGGPLTAAELFDYIRQVTHELSDQRQIVALRGPEGLDLDRYVVVEATRGIAVRPFSAEEEPAGGLEIRPADPPGEKPGDQLMKAAFPAQTERPAGPPIKLASLDGRLADLSELPRVAPVVLVAPNADPDLVWDPNSHDVLAGADVIARNIPLTALPGVIDRMSVLNALKKNVALHAQNIRLLPGDDLHHRGSRIEIDVGDLIGRNLVLFDLTGVGEAQLLYPLGSDPPQRSAPNYTVELQVREPFGADLIVAVTANQSLSALVDLLKKSGRRLSPSRFSEALAGVNPQGLRIGYVGLFTTP